MKKILIILIFLFSACGYQPIYKVDNKKNLIFKNIELVGDNKINKKVISAIGLKKDNSNKSLNEIIISSNKKTEGTSKNSKGQIATYRTTLKLNITIKKNDEVVREKEFFKDFSYNNKENKFDLSEYQKEIEISLTNQIIEELIIYLNL